MRIISSESDFSEGVPGGNALVVICILRSDKNFPADDFQAPGIVDFMTAVALTLGSAAHVKISKHRIGAGQPVNLFSVKIITGEAGRKNSRGSDLTADIRTDARNILGYIAFPHPLRSDNFLHFRDSPVRIASRSSGRAAI